jgi:very-short-patch-repair endonuclease
MDVEARTALRRIAERQRGLFSAVQAAHVGIDHHQLSWAARHGDLRRVRYGVYAMTGVPRSAWEELVAAALAAGPGAAISHSSAAAAHRLYGAAFGPPELTLPPRSQRRMAAVVTHRRVLPPEDIVQKYGVLVTSPARTLVDMAGRLEPVLLEKTLDEGLIERRFRMADMLACLGRSAPNAPGRARLERLLELRREAPTADSALEALAFEALKPLAPFRTHFVTELGSRVYVIDVAWPRQRVGAEVVGRAHRVVSLSAFDRERRKLNVLGAAGWQIAHLTAAMTADEMVAAVEALMIVGRASGGP